MSDLSAFAMSPTRKQSVITEISSSNIVEEKRKTGKKRNAPKPIMNIHYT